jgi:hypothetical protein
MYNSSWPSHLWADNSIKIGKGLVKSTMNFKSYFPARLKQGKRIKIYLMTIRNLELKESPDLLPSREGVRKQLRNGRGVLYAMLVRYSFKKSNYYRFTNTPPQPHSLPAPSQEGNKNQIAGNHNIFIYVFTFYMRHRCIWWVEYQFHSSPSVPIGTPDHQFANSTHQKFRWNLKNAPF